MKKTAFTLIAFYLLCCPEIVSANTVEPFQKKKPDLLTKFIKAGIDEKFANNVLSDRRLLIYGNDLPKKNGILNFPDRTFGIFKKDSIIRGNRVMTERKSVLDKVYERYGIQAEYLVSIYWIETKLGANLGKNLVINSLLTLALSGSRRAQWAEKELIAFVDICYKQNFDPFLIIGSSAGAFGRMQFIPSSYVSFAVSANSNKIKEVDLFNLEDAMFSAGNYLYRHGWDKNDSTKIKKAIFAYNHSMDYVNAVMTYASFIKPPCVACEGD